MVLDLVRPLAAAQRWMGDAEGLVDKALSMMDPHNSCTLPSRREGETEGREEGTELVVRLTEGGEDTGTEMVGGAEEGREEEEEEGEGWKEQMMGTNPTDQ